jgi:uncharacterized protein
VNYFDINAWIGNWPFRTLRDNTPQTLVARLQRAGIRRAAVSSVEAVFQRHVQPANEKLAADLEGWGESLVPLATLNPRYPHWQDDLRRCHEELGMKGVRLFPPYHGYDVDGPQAVQAVSACAERDLPVFIPFRLEDQRQRHWMDPGAQLDLTRTANLIDKVPQATVVVTNARGLVQSPLWQRQDLRGRSWYFDLSLAEVHYILHTRPGRMRDLADFIEEGGAPHLLFGTHAPFSYPAAARVKAAILPVEAKTLAEICWNRASRLLDGKT